MTTAAKKALREEMKSTLAVLSEDEVASQSQRAQNAVLALPQYKEAMRISVYLSMPSGEARTDRIVMDALEKGKKVFVPFIHAAPATLTSNDKPRKKPKMMSMLCLSTVAEFQALERDSWGIPFLPHSSIEERENADGGKGLSVTLEPQVNVGGLDLIVVPGLAFDQEMNRIGHGAGFYDAFLTRSIVGGKRPKPFLAGLCLAEQLLSPGRISMESWDWKVDVVVTGQGQQLQPS